MKPTKFIKDILNALSRGTQMDEETKKMIKWVLIGAVVVIAVFVLGYSCGAGSAAKQSEVIQQIKALVNGF